jgi:hypothetical protein
LLGAPFAAKQCKPGVSRLSWKFLAHSFNRSNAKLVSRLTNCGANVTAEADSNTQNGFWLDLSRMEWFGSIFLAWSYQKNSVAATVCFTTVSFLLARIMDRLGFWTRPWHWRVLDLAFFGIAFFIRPKHAVCSTPSLPNVKCPTTSKGAIFKRLALFSSNLLIQWTPH